MSFSAQSNPFDLREKHLKAIFVSEETMKDSAIFNPNEYASSLEGGINACSDRYIASLNHTRSTISEIINYRRRGFNEELDFINKELPLTKYTFGRVNCPTVYSSFEALLIASKSLLDVLCRYLLRYKVKVSIDAFHKGDHTVGGQVLRILKGSVSLSTLPTRDDLISLIEEHKTLWIDECVSMRDAVIHSGDLQRHFMGFWILFEAGRSRPYTMADIQDPILRRGNTIETVEAYCRRHLTLIKKFTMSFIDLLFPVQDRAKELARRFGNQG